RMAEREGFEPSVEFPLHTLSKRAPSTTRTSLPSTRFARSGRARLSGTNSLAGESRRPRRPARLRGDLTCDLSMGKAVGAGQLCSRESDIVPRYRCPLRPFGGAMTPGHYARDLVERCDTLIESLLPVVMNDPSTRFGGPLGT